MSKFTTINPAPTRYINYLQEDIGLTDKDRAKRKESMKRRKTKKYNN